MWQRKREHKESFIFIKYNESLFRVNTSIKIRFLHNLKKDRLLKKKY